MFCIHTRYCSRRLASAAALRVLLLLDLAQRRPGEAIAASTAAIEAKEANEVFGARGVMGCHGVEVQGGSGRRGSMGQ